MKTKTRILNLLIFLPFAARANWHSKITKFRAISVLGFALFLMVSNSLFAQFETCNSSTSKDLYDIFFIDSEIGIAVGDSGTIVRSIDAGLNWETVLSVDTIWLRKVAFFNEQIGLAIGSDIYRTVDGGINWTIVEFDQLQYFADIAIFNDSTCVISGNPDRLIRSNDYGLTWDVLYDETSQFHFNFLSFLNSEIGFSSLAIDGIGSNLIGKTTNGGVDWEVVNGEGFTVPTVLEAFKFLSEDEGFNGGWYNPQLEKTTDGGATWNQAAIDTSGLIFSAAVLDFHINADQPNSYFASCWYGELYKSIDGGDSWMPLETGASTTSRLYGVYFIDEQNGWVVGSDGLILKTTTGGEILSIDKAELSLKLKVFPNPSSNELKIQFEEGISIRQLELMDTNGKVVKSFPNNLTQLDLSGLASGVYILKILTDHGVVNKRIVME
ncbi:T9SS type A sorting domain-containing protein [Cryomorpha ignava]|uniref:T9SS type A sorting domain-containing protein n=1 Tax=Cryomorpha ignava TaxID=101383 RepID=A0A7K3WT69_9FLAO|nr:YCF48-related protein [Cryomorpha ignava]NEN24880.1 T9SS type A sorting domain-containing protein [Cryomorpha ignava]